MNDGTDHKSWASKQILNELKTRTLQRFGPNRDSKEVYVDDKIRLKTNFLEYLESGTQTNVIPIKILPNLDYVFKTGIDKQVQVIENEIFNFNLEVQPIVYALRSRIVYESLQEVQFELDIKTLNQLKEKIILNEKAKQYKEDQYFKNEQQKQLKTSQTKNEFKKQKSDEINVSKKLLTRALTKKLFQRLDGDVQIYIRKFGSFISKNLCLINEEYKFHI